MYEVFVVIMTLGGSVLPKERRGTFGGFAEAEDFARLEVERVTELCGVLDWTVTVEQLGTTLASWGMDDAQSAYEHGLLNRDHFDVMFYLARKNLLSSD